jgi:hypothetical protein
METNKPLLSKKKLSKAKLKNTTAQKVSVSKNTGLCLFNSSNSNPLKIITVSWQKAERLDNQMRKAIY